MIDLLLPYFFFRRACCHFLYCNLLQEVFYLLWYDLFFRLIEIYFPCEFLSIWITEKGNLITFTIANILRSPVRTSQTLCFSLPAICMVRSRFSKNIFFSPADEPDYSFLVISDEISVKRVALVTFVLPW